VLQLLDGLSAEDFAPTVLGGPEKLRLKIGVARVLLLESGSIRKLHVQEVWLVPFAVRLEPAIIGVLRGHSKRGLDNAPTASSKSSMQQPFC
jgi:hypothetical protein